MVGYHLWLQVPGLGMHMWVKKGQMVRKLRLRFICEKRVGDIYGGSCIVTTQFNTSIQKMTNNYT